MNKRAVLLAFAAIALGAAACGDSGSSSANNVVGTTTTTASTTSGATAGKLPDACTLVDDTAAGTAMGTAATKGTAPQPPTEISARCEWKNGTYALSLLVQKGTAAKSSFDNATSGFTPITVSGTDARISLGAHETSRNYRTFSVASYNGTYYVYFTVQGTDRDDGAANSIGQQLVGAALSKLPK